MMIDSFVAEAVDEEVTEIPAEGYMVMIDNFVMEAVEEETDIPFDVALADEPEGYMVIIDSFVMEAVDEEVADILVDVAVAGKPEGYPVQSSCSCICITKPKKPRQSSARTQHREPPSCYPSRRTCWRSGVSVLDGLSEAMN